VDALEGKQWASTYRTLAPDCERVAVWLAAAFFCASRHKEIGAVAFALPNLGPVALQPGCLLLHAG